MFDIGDIFSLGGLDEARGFVDRIRKMSNSLKDARHSGTACGGLVTVTLNGMHELTHCKIDPSLAGDVELIEELIVAAVTNATETLHEQVEGGFRKFAEHMLTDEPCNCPACQAKREALLKGNRP